VINHWLIFILLSFFLRVFDDARDDLISKQYDHRRKINNAQQADRIPKCIRDDDYQKSRVYSS
jgi:hypothetical protein